MPPALFQQSLYFHSLNSQYFSFTCLCSLAYSSINQTRKRLPCLLCHVEGALSARAMYAHILQSSKSSTSTLKPYVGHTIHANDKSNTVLRQCPPSMMEVNLNVSVMSTKLASASMQVQNNISMTLHSEKTTSTPKPSLED